MTTVRELRQKARELGITGRSTMRKAELLAAIQEVVRLGSGLGTSAGTSAFTKAVEPAPTRPNVEPEPAPPAPAPRPHPHAGIGPLLQPLELPELPDRYDVRHLAVLPKTPREVVVVWSLSPLDFARARDRQPVLRVWCEDGILHTASVHHPIGRWYAAGLRPDQHVWAEITAGTEVLALSKRVALPPDAPSRLHHPLYVSIDVDRPLSKLPRDLRRGAPTEPPRPEGALTASERSWRRATRLAATPAEPDPQFVAGPDEPAALDPIDHETLVSSLMSSHHARPQEA